METVVEVIESKKDEVLEKVVEQVEEKKEEVEQKVEEVADKAEEAVEKAADEVAKKLEEAAKPITDIIESNPQVAKAIDMVDDIIGDRLDGREISCSCFGWLVALRIARKSKKTSQAKPEEIPKIQAESPSQDSKVEEERPPTAPQSE